MRVTLTHKPTPLTVTFGKSCSTPQVTFDGKIIKLPQENVYFVLFRFRVMMIKKILLIEVQSVYSTIFLDIPQSSSIFLNIPGYSSIFSDIPQSSPIFLSIPRYSSIFPDILQYSPIFLNIPRYSSIFPDIPQYSTIVLNIPRYSSIFPNITRYQMRLNDFNASW